MGRPLCCQHAPAKCAPSKDSPAGSGEASGAESGEAAGADHTSGVETMATESCPADSDDPVDGATPAGTPIAAALDDGATPVGTPIAECGAVTDAGRAAERPEDDTFLKDLFGDDDNAGAAQRVEPVPDAEFSFLFGEDDPCEAPGVEAAEPPPLPPPHRSPNQQEEQLDGAVGDATTGEALLGSEDREREPAAVAPE